MDELGELVCHDEPTLADEMLGRNFFNEPFWPAGAPPTDEAARRALVASWAARIRGEPTATPTARCFRVWCDETLGAYAALTEEAALCVHVLHQSVHRLTEEEGCAVMGALAGRLPALQRVGVSDAQLHAMLPMWRAMAAAGRSAGLIHLTVWSGNRQAPAAPVPPLADLLPRLQSLHLHENSPAHLASWCAMLAGEGAPALVTLSLPAPPRDVLPDDQAALYVEVLGRQAGSLRNLKTEPYGMSAGAAEALDAAIVALPHLVNLRTSPVAVRGSLRVLGGRAPRLRNIAVRCRYGIDPAAFLIAWLRGLAPSVERIEFVGLEPRVKGPSAPPWRGLAAALRALGARPALRKLSLSTCAPDGPPWLKSVLSPTPDVVAAPVWPHLEELECGIDADGVQLDLRHFPRLRKFDGTLLDAASVSTVMRSAACRDVQLLGASVSLAAADAAALPPKERLAGSLSGATAEETVAALASVVGGWADLRELDLSAGRDLEVSEATQVALVHALGRCTHLRELWLPFPLCPAAAAVLAAALPRLPDVCLVSVCGVTTTSLLALVRGLPGTGGGASDPGRKLRAAVRGAGDAATTTDDLRELGASAVVAAQRGWVLIFSGQEGLTPAWLVTQLQALALRRDWRDCIVLLGCLDVAPAGFTLWLRRCGLVGWQRGECWR
jgi:hypothetical protein